ncbi:MAG: hypothetical protein ACSLFI_09005 [Solirubrobacterales bacterium]
MSLDPEDHGVVGTASVAGIVVAAAATTDPSRQGAGKDGDDECGFHGFQRKPLEYLSHGDAPLSNQSVTSLSLTILLANQ